jgi:hypothetical protein
MPGLTTAQVSHRCRRVPLGSTYWDAPLIWLAGHRAQLSQRVRLLRFVLSPHGPAPATGSTPVTSLAGISVPRLIAGGSC